MKPWLFAFDMNSHLARIFKTQAPKDKIPTGPGAFYNDEPVFCLKPLFNLVQSEINHMRKRGVENTHIVLVFDDQGKNFRHRLYERYKANRPPKPKEWVRQEELMYDMFVSLGFPCVRISDYEADDVLKTLSCKMSGRGYNTTIFTGDKDIMSCCDKFTSIFSGKIKKLYLACDVEKKFGVSCDKVLDYLAMIGDVADNVPGVSGVGEVSARKILNRYSLKAVIREPELILNLDIRDKKKIVDTIKKDPEGVALSRQLVDLKDDVPLGMNLSEMVRKAPDYSAFLDGFMRPSV